MMIKNNISEYLSVVKAQYESFVETLIGRFGEGSFQSIVYCQGVCITLSHHIEKPELLFKEIGIILLGFPEVKIHKIGIDKINPASIL